MSETFRDLTPGELQATLIQFMGQNLGEIKKLDADIIDKNNTLQGFTLQPEAILRSLPVPNQPPPQPIQPQPVQVVAPPVVQASGHTQEQAAPNEVDPDQLVFDFINDLKSQPSLKDTIITTGKHANTIPDLNASLYNLNKKIDQIIEMLNEGSFKKKSD